MQPRENMKEKPIRVYVLLFHHENMNEIIGTYSTYELAEKYLNKYVEKLCPNGTSSGRLNIYHSPFDYGEVDTTQQDLADSGEEDRK